MGVFMVKTMKRVIFQETRQYGEGGDGRGDGPMFPLVVCKRL
jgi:hypothetical protein